MTHKVCRSLCRNFRSLAIMVWVWGFLEVSELKDDSMNESMNYKGVCRTAPATPGLLIILLGKPEGEGSKVAYILKLAWIAKTYERRVFLSANAEARIWPITNDIILFSYTYVFETFLAWTRSEPVRIVYTSGLTATQTVSTKTIHGL